MNLRARLTRADVVVAGLCTFLLVGVLGTIDPQGQERAKRSVCVYQVREHVAALLSYAQDHAGRLPACDESSGHWLWDVDGELMNDLLGRGLRRESFYCPSNVTSQRHMDRLWEMSANWNGNRFFTRGYISTDYGYIIQGKPTRRLNIAGSGNKKWLASTNLADASSRELVVDGTISLTEPGTPSGRKFGEIQAGMYNISRVCERTNHLRDVEHPWGGNIGFLDGHVSWRPFEQMESRYADPTRWYKTPPSFWW
jgi:prepilin-type processing-associated H-X9-DG protein